MRGARAEKYRKEVAKAHTGLRRLRGAKSRANHLEQGLRAIRSWCANAIRDQAVLSREDMVSWFQAIEKKSTRLLKGPDVKAPTVVD